MEAQNTTYLIYKHTNKINGKIYVGQTCLKLSRRCGRNGNKYKNYTILPNGKKKPSHFWSAIQKYGWENFEHKVLIHGLTKEQADVWEKKLIKVWDLMNSEKGYNKREGGSGGRLSNETRKKLSKSHKGMQSGDKNPRAVTIYCIETGEKFTTFKEAGKKYNIASSHLKDACINYSKTRANLHWAYEENYLNMTKEDKDKILSQDTSRQYHNNPNSKKVIDILNNVIYLSIKECAEKNNITPATVWKHCNNRVDIPKFMYYNI